MAEAWTTSLGIELATTRNTLGPSRWGGLFYGGYGMCDVSKLLIARASIFLAEAVNGSVQFTLEGVDVAIHPGDTEQAVMSKMGGTQVPQSKVPDEIITMEGMAGIPKRWIGKPDPGYKGEVASIFHGPGGSLFQNPEPFNDNL
jgi:hypothetical protein